MTAARASLGLPLAVSLFVLLVSPSHSTAQSPGHRLLMQDRTILEQLPVAISRTLARAEPDAELEAEVQGLFQEAVGHYTSGRTGETRRILYRTLATVLGREWTSRDDYWRSLLLRTDTVVSDPARPLIVRLVQIYPGAYEPVAPLRMRARVIDRSRSNAPQAIRDLGEFDDIGVDFIDSPVTFAVDLSGLEDGRTYEIEVEVLEGDDLLRRLGAAIFVQSDLEARRVEVERRLAAIDGHDSAKATVRYPFDRALQLDLGRLDPEGYDFAAAIARSMELISALESGEDPLYGATGDHERHYWLDEAREIMPYRIQVPRTYDGGTPYPLIVALHGMDGSHDSLFEMDGGILPKAAEEDGYILVSPMGYRRNGGYGSTTVQGAPASPTRRRLTRLSYLDVMNVLELVRDEYRIDDRRIYLMGGSMGGGGTWRIASRHPGIWAAIAPICPGITLDEVDLEGMRHIPVVVSHGDADATVPVERSRTMVAAMEKLGMVYEYHEIPGGGHLILKEALQPMMGFFGRHKKPPVSGEH
jgi:predicted esterase